MISTKRLIIVGAGGHGKVVAEIAFLCGYENVVFLDSNEELIGTEIGNKHVLVGGTPSDIDRFDGDVFVAIGDSDIRRTLTDFYLMKKNRNIITLIHPAAIVSEGSIIEDGVVVMPGAVINTGATIQNGSIINTSCSIDHDCHIGSYSHIAPGAHLCGGVKMQHDCWIGAGATIINNVNLVNNVNIGAGAVVLKSIIESGTYIGVPAKKVK